MKIQIDHLNMTVENLGKSIDWYGSIFGFEPVEKGTYMGSPWTIIRKDETMLCLYEDSGKKLEQTEDHLRIFHFGLKISDREAWEKTVQEKKLKLLYGGLNRYPHSISWYVEDPSGHEIEVAYWDNNEVKF